MKYMLLIALAAGLAYVAVTQVSVDRYFNDKPSVVLQAKDQKTSPTLLFVGDVMLGRNVELLSNKNGKEFPFENISDWLQSVDIVIANLEGPITDPHVMTPSQGMSFTFASTTPQLLYDHNIRIVNLANNHTGDKGEAAFQQTQKFLNKAGIIYAGHPYKFGDDYVRHIKIGDEKFLFVSFNLTNPNLDLTKALAFVKALPKDEDETMVAMVHGGDEYVLTSNKRQKTFYRGLIDSGADFVIAHHPHVVEEIEQYKNKLIFYSLGNFIFDQYFSKDVQDELAVKYSHKGNEHQFELIPLFGNHSQPKLVEGEDKQTFLNELAARSSPSLQESIKKGVISITQ